MGGRRNHFYTRHSTKCRVVLAQDFVRASSLMLWEWGVIAANAPQEILFQEVNSPPRTGVLTHSGAVHSKSNILPAAVNTLEAPLEVIGPSGKSLKVNAPLELES